MSILLLPILAITIFAVLQPQRVRQFAQTYSTPPLFGCLQVGEGSSTDCASKLGSASTFSLAINGKPIPADDENEMAYINDILTASYSFKSTGDLPIDIKSYGVAAGSLNQLYVLPFKTLEGKKTLAPGQSVSGKNVTLTIKGLDLPAGKWIAGPGVTNTAGTAVPIDPQYSRKFNVNPACTALRVQPLTSADKKNIQALCQKDPNNKLCTSKQYCQIIKGGKCNQAEASPATPTAECNTSIVLAKGEQDVLENLCKSYPNTPACKDFCKRSIGAKICPPVILWFDNKTHKQVFPKPAKYLADAGQEQQIANYNEDMNNYNANINNSPSSLIQDWHTYLSAALNTFRCDITLGIYCPQDNQQVAGAMILAAVPAGNNDALRMGDAMGAMGPPPPAAAPQGSTPTSHGVPIIGNQRGRPVTAPQPGEAGYKPSCASHRGNDSGECCTSGFPLINGCCQPGCFVYHSEQLSPSNCPYKDKGGACCAQGVVESLGYCQASQAQGKPGIDPNTPRDPKIFPPGALPAGGGSGQCDGPSGPGPCNRGGPAPAPGGGGGSTAPGGGAPAQPAQPLLPNEHGSCGNFGSNCGAGLSCHYQGGSNAPGTCERIPGYIPPAPPPAQPAQPVVPPVNGPAQCVASGASCGAGASGGCCSGTCNRGNGFTSGDTCK